MVLFCLGDVVNKILASHIISVSGAHTNTMTGFKVAYLQTFHESNVLCGDEIGYIELCFQLFCLAFENVLKAFVMGTYKARSHPEASVCCFFNRDIVCEC